MNKLVGIIIALAIGTAVGFAIGGSKLDSDSSSGGSNSSERKIAYWVAPMDPNYRRDEPGKSPMGMDLIPVYEDEINGSGDDSNAVRISPSVINNLGVRTAKVKKVNFHNEIKTVGYVSYNENLINHVHMRTEGWVKKVYVHSIGERVKKDTPLFDIYSPELVNAQADYINALRSGGRTIIRASKERMRALAIPEDVIEEIAKTRRAKQIVTIKAPADGIITALNVVDGMYVTAMTTAVSIVDLSSVWVLVDVFEAQTSWIKEGLTAEMRLSYLPGRVFKGQISYIYPDIDKKTRTLKVRMEFDNPDEILKPEMYAYITIMAAPKLDAIVIPKEALIRTGNSERVILALGEGRFQPAKVEVGLENDNEIEILSGLDEGEEIVISAQFLIDSEASFTGSTIRMLPAQEEVDDISSVENEDAEKHKAEEDTKPDPNKEGFWIVGKINSILDDGSKANVTHDPVEVMGWPAMTMDFLLDSNIDISQIEIGKEIHFKSVKDESGMYKIVEIMKM